MTFEQLEYFISVVEHDTFFDAAESLHITQSALSKQIMKLEKELNVKLLDRSKRKASLTEAGQFFYEESLLLFTQYNQTLLNMRQFKEDLSSKLHIGTLPILTQYHLTSMIKNFTDHNPQIHLTMDESEENELLEGLGENRFHLIISRNHMLNQEKYNFISLTEDRLVVVLPANHPMANKASVTLNEIANESFLLMRPHTSIYQVCINLFEKHAIPVNIRRTARIESIISAIAVGEGVSLIPEKNFHLFRHNNIVIIPLDNSPTLPVGIAWKKNYPLSPSAKSFIDFLRRLQ